MVKEPAPRYAPTIVSCVLTADPPGIRATFTLMSGADLGAKTLQTPLLVDFGAGRIRPRPPGHIAPLVASCRSERRSLAEPSEPQPVVDVLRRTRLPLRRGERVKQPHGFLKTLWNPFLLRSLAKPRIFCCGKFVYMCGICPLSAKQMRSRQAWHHKQSKSAAVFVIFWGLHLIRFSSDAMYQLFLVPNLPQPTRHILSLFP